ncbi:MAG: S8 family serine peptidase [Dermatophilaceae bacterium]
MSTAGSSRTAYRRLTVAMATVVVAATGTAPAPAAAAASDRSIRVAPAVAERDPVKVVRGNDRLGQRDRELLATATRTGARRVTMLVATQRDRTEEVAAAIRAQGGTVVTQNDQVGYLRASVPTGRAERVAGAARVLAVDLDERIRRPDLSVATVARARGAETVARTRGAATAAATGPGPATPLDNPYLPIRDTGSAAFRAAHPTWDGRGVTIGILDSGVDLDHPALRTTSTGERKVVDWITATDPVFDGDGSWLAMTTTVAGPTFTVPGVGGGWSAPAGAYQFARFSESVTTPSEPAGDVNRDGDTTDRFGVLYDPVSNDVWVDADQDQAFESAERMRPYEEAAQVRHFGSATDPTDRMPFVIEYREDVDATAVGLPSRTDFVNIGIVEDAHGTHVAGIAAGNDLFGGAVDGQAPGAQLVSARACSWGGVCTSAALTDGMIDLVSNRGVDVVNMSIASLPALNDANNARARLYDALVDEYGVQIVVSAGNDGPGLNTVSDLSASTGVISVGSSISKATWLANYGATVSRDLGLHSYSSRGPGEDGGFKPNVVAPGSAISTVPQWQKQPDIAGYPLPLGYAMFNGTSMASPQVAGAAALLLSAGTATGTPVSPRQLRESIYTAADFTAGLEAVSQGNGLVDVPGAWALLATRPATPTFSTRAPVCTPISDLLAVPDQGAGLYNRCDPAAGGLAVGQRRVHDIVVARTSGGRWLTHRVRIVGNDGTFSAPGTAIVGSVERPIRVTAAPTTPGLHSAILEIDDPATPLVDHRVMLAVVAAESVPGPRYTRTWTGSVERSLYQRHFVTVPRGADVLQVGLSGVASGQHVRWIAVDPYGLPVDPTASSLCFTGSPSDCSATSRDYTDPTPGVWELHVEARHTSSALSNGYALSAALQGTTLTPATQNVTTAVGTAKAITPIRVRSDLGSVSVTPRDAALGSSRTARPSVADGAATEFTVTVPSNSARLEVAIGNPADLSADLDLSVYQGTTVMAQDADGDSEESVSIEYPRSGTYRVVVEGFAVPAGTTAFDYLDVFIGSSLGTIDVPNSALAIPAGASATVSGTVTPRVSAGPGRSLVGTVRLVASTGAVLGTATVNVNP